MKTITSSMLILCVLLSCSKTSFKNIQPNKSNFQNHLNVLDFGADPTGKESSQKAFEEAISEAIRLNKTLFIPSGTYIIEKTIIIDDIIHIKGQGKFQCGIRLKSKEKNSWIFSFEKGSNGSILEGFSMANENGNGIRHEVGILSIIKEIKAGFGLKGTAFYATESIGIKYIDCEVGTNGQQFFKGKSRPEYGFYITSKNRFSSNQAQIERCYVAGCRKDGIFIDGSNHRDTYSLYAIINNTISEGNFGHGINIHDAQGVRVSNCHMEANKNGDLNIQEAHGFQWNGGIIGDTKIINTHGALFLSSVIGELIIDDESYNCTFIGGTIQLSNKTANTKGKWNDNTFVGVIRNNYAANGNGASQVSNQNLFGQVISENGDFERWVGNPEMPDFYSVTGTPHISKSRASLLGDYCVKLVSSGKNKFEGLSFDVSSIIEDNISRNYNQRISISIWVNMDSENLWKPIVLGQYKGYYNEWAKRNKSNTQKKGWTLISYSLAYAKGMKVLISFPENTPKDKSMLIDGLTITLGNSSPSMFHLGHSESIGETINNGKINKEGHEPPAKGEFLKGDIIHNNNPKSGSFIGWVCIKSGNPGIWKGFGKIE